MCTSHSITCCEKKLVFDRSNMPKNHDGVCGPCVLCNKTGGKYNHFDMLNRETQGALRKEYRSINFTVSSCICYTCFKRCQHNKNNLWKSEIAAKTPKQCQLECCNRMFHSNWSRSDVSDVETLLGSRVTGFEVKDGSTFIGLCKEHYNSLYCLHEVPQCSFCGVKQKGTVIVNRKCPEPDKINSYLQDVLLDTEYTLDSDDLICFKCYKHCRAILARMSKREKNCSCEACSNNGIDHLSLAKIKDTIF